MLELIRKYGEPLEIAKGEHLLEQGRNNGSLYVVASGLLKAYYITSSGKEFVKSFIDVNGYIASISAILGTSPCSFSVVALENSHVLRVSGDTILNVSQEDPDSLKLINQALLQLVQKKEKREYEFLCLSAEERYASFRKEFSGLESRVSQYDIARYLGITPVALSRIRGRM